MSLKMKVMGIVFLLILLMHGVPFLIPLSTQSVGTPEKVFDNSQWISVDGVDLHYRLWIPEQTIHDPIVYIHGLGGSTFSWRENIDPFVEEGFPVIALDLPAFGYSSRKTGLIHSQGNRSRWVFGLLDDLENQGRIKKSQGYHLVGHSMGGGVITAMALNRPYDIQSLTYVAGAVMNEPPRTRKILSYPPIKRMVGVLGERIFFRENRLEGVLESAYGRRISEDELRGYLDPLREPGTGRAWGDLMTTTTSFRKEEIQEIAILSLLIWGEEDAWISLNEGIRLEEALQNSPLVIIEESGHCPMETDSDEFNQRLLEYLSDFSS